MMLLIYSCFTTVSVVASSGERGYDLTWPVALAEQACVSLL